MTTINTIEQNKTPTKTLVSFKIDKKLKKEAVKICDEIGIPFSTFLNITIKDLVRTKRFVGEVNYMPNESTIKAITLAEKDFAQGTLKNVPLKDFLTSLRAK